MSDVFVSYSRKNRGIAERIAQDLRRCGHSVFYDMELVPGEDWSARLSQELSRAKYVLVLLSPAYVTSNWARRELEAAVLSETDGGPRVLPVLVQDTDVPAVLQDKHYADLSTDYESGFAQVKRALEKRPAQTEKSRARRSRRAEEILSVLGSLLAAAAGVVVSLVGAIGTDPLADIVGVVIPAVAVGAVGLTALVAAISHYPYRRVGATETVAREVENAYIEALDESRLNPFRVGEVRHG